MFFFSAEVLALLTALAFAVSDTLMGAGVRTSTPYAGAVALSFLVGACYAAAMPWVLPGLKLNAAGVFWFLLVGVSQLGLGMFFFYLSMRRVGVARAAVISASAPVFSVALAVLFLGERPTVFIYIGTMAVVLGVMASAGWKPGPGGENRRLGPADLALPLLTALLFGVSPLFREVGLGNIASIPLASALAGMGGFVTLLLLSPVFPRPERFAFERRSARLFFAGGLVMAGAQATFFLALMSGPVSVVVPLIFVKPVFVAAIVFLTGRGREKMGASVFVGAVLMAAGAWLLLGFR